MGGAISFFLKNKQNKDTNNYRWKDNLDPKMAKGVLGIRK